LTCSMSLMDAFSSNSLKGVFLKRLLLDFLST